MSEKQIAKLKKASQKKKQAALDRTEKAIAELSKNSQKITIRSVAKKAGVSVSYIYKYPELSYKIQRLKEQQKYSSIEGDRTSESEIEVTALEHKKIELIQEIEEIKSNIERFKTGENSLEDFQTENIKLRLENKKLKEELEYTRKNLQETREFILETGYIDQDYTKTENKTKVIRAASQT